MTAWDRRDGFASCRREPQGVINEERGQYSTKEEGESNLVSKPIEKDRCLTPRSGWSETSPELPPKSSRRRKGGSRDVNQGSIRGTRTKEQGNAGSKGIYFMTRAPF